MSSQISRRDFLKLSGAGIAAAILTGCGPLSRYVTREPYTQMPEYSYNGISTYYATACRECPAGCGMQIRHIDGRAINVDNAREQEPRRPGGGFQTVSFPDERRGTAKA